MTEAPQRRIDLSLSRLQDEFDALPEPDRIKASNDPRLRLIELLSRVRGMEMAETGALLRPTYWRTPPGETVADLYDRLVTPGEPALPALLRVAKAAFGSAADA